VLHASRGWKEGREYPSLQRGYPPTAVDYGRWDSTVSSLIGVWGTAPDEIEFEAPQAS